MNYQTFWTKRAQGDLDSILAYIAEDSSISAARMVDSIFAAVLLLEQFPHRNLIDPQPLRVRFPVRTLPVEPYVVFFRVIEGTRTVRIVHVRHGARRRPTF